eukprot:COSAG02_NODE_2501_length_8672_cov_7.293246_7_plen_247_part_00
MKNEWLYVNPTTVYHTEREMDALQNMIVSGMATQGCALSPEQNAALMQVLGQAGETDEGLPAAAELMSRMEQECDRRLDVAHAIHRRELRGWLNPTLYVSDGGTAQRNIAHPLRNAALVAQGHQVQLHDDELALAPGPPDETLQFRYTFQLPAQAVVCTDADLRRCQNYRFENGSLHVDNGNGDVQSYPAHISHVWDIAHMPHAEASLTMQDQGTEVGLLGEDIATVGVDWQSGADLAQAWDDMMQ